MPLIQLWEQTPEIILKYNIKQIVSAAGDGVLKDSSECSQELRHFLSNAPAQKLYEHVEYCLNQAFDKSGSVLQDIINEFGRRLDYDVQNGLYQGRVNQVGYDGIWKTPEGQSIILEVKTSDAYRINLDVIAGYRNKLIEAGQITKQSSILIVVGRNDTGDLEAQIRGSRHAWDIRIISTDALIKLLELKMKSDEDETTEKIRNLLLPFEYTRLDNIIDVIFTTTKDVETAEKQESLPEQDEMSLGVDQVQSHTPREELEKLRYQALEALGKREGAPLIAHKRTQFWSVDKKLRVVCVVSKQYRSKFFWYAYHPRQDKFLSEANEAYFILGCLGNNMAYALPWSEIHAVLPFLHKTETKDRLYWHIHLHPHDNGQYELSVPGDKANIALSPFAIKLDEN